jgi:hypothetical protein
MPLTNTIFLLSSGATTFEEQHNFAVQRERRIDRAGRMSLVHATPACTGYVAYISERAFTQGTFL